MGRFYITTAIDYSNGDPHLGHAVEKIGADVIARYRRSRGDDVRFLIGMDEHGQKVQLEARKQGEEPQAWVDRIASEFLDAWARLEISNDDFIRTSEPRHHEGVKALMARVKEAGGFYRSAYAGYYCAGCEAFKKEDELVDGQCPLHPNREVEWTEEDNWFFRLSDYADRLLAYIEEHPDFIRPAKRRNEILRLLEGGLEDISASRSRISWGIPFPGDEEHTVYVWFDALSNYITALGYPDGDEVDAWWPADLHVIGKDITRFHCVYWPAWLMAAGIEPPRGVWGHGFINIGGAKLSKSAGTELGLIELIDRHGADALRYFLMREVPWDGDRDFATSADFLEQFDTRYTADLANDLGNLLNRVVSMISKYRDGEVPSPSYGALAHRADQAVVEYREAMDAHLLHQGIAAAFDIVRAANGYVDETQPWALAKAEREGGSTAELSGVLSDLARAIGTAACLLAPFMPKKASEVWSVVGGEGEAPSLEGLGDALFAIAKVRPGPVLFPRPETD